MTLPRRTSPYPYTHVSPGAPNVSLLPLPLSRPVVLGLALTVACGGGGNSSGPNPPPPPQTPGPNQVLVVNNTFNPTTLTVGVGVTVTFTWGNGARTHTVTPNGAAIPASPNQPQTHDSPFSFQATFPTAGTFKYFCLTHGAPNSGMRGTIVVQ